MLHLMNRRQPTAAAFDDHSAVANLNGCTRPLRDAADLDPLLRHIGDARVVLLGEASHGTHEYYTWRATLSKRLIKERGFSFIAVEGDWPDCYQLNRFVKNYTPAEEAVRTVLQTFDRWPTWMWANWEVAAFAEWLRKYNRPLRDRQKVGFYGLDVYSLWESLAAVEQYLQHEDPEAARTARKAFRCFEPYREEGQAYGQAAMLTPASCREEVVELLREIRHKAPRYDGDPEHAFSTEQNAHVIVNAERYYRLMMEGGPDSWNLRDRHMTDTLHRLLQFHGPQGKAIIWAHNTHIGDARATDMADAGMYNIGQLCRQELTNAGVVLVGFGSQRGTVVAGRKWGAPMEVLPVPAAPSASWEGLLHRAREANQMILMDELGEDSLFRNTLLGHRAIGVVYNPEYERRGNYVPSVLPQRYDAFLFFDKTHALHPLHLEPHGNVVPETFPFGV